MEYEQHQSKMRKLATLKVRKDSLRELRLALQDHFANATEQSISEGHKAHEREI